MNADFEHGGSERVRQDVQVVERLSPNNDERPGPVDMLILHYTGMQSAEAAIERLRDPAARVSSHYVVDEVGTVFCLVPEDRRAWHAGVSFWQGRRVLNDCSVGIEIVNPGHEWGYRAFPPAQMEAVRQLSIGIMGRHGIAARRVLGHSDVAPDRKQDPGELFDWPWLAASGVGIWPTLAPRTRGATLDEAGLIDLAGVLGSIGYDTSPGTPPLPDVVTAFQRHWMQQRVGSEPDDALLAQARAVLASSQG